MASVPMDRKVIPRNDESHLSCIQPACRVCQAIACTDGVSFFGRTDFP